MTRLRGREKRKIQSLGGSHEGRTTGRGYTPLGLPGPPEGGHDVPREPGELLAELARRNALGPVDYHLVEPRVLGLDLADGLDHLRRPAAEPRFLLDAVTERGNARWRAGRAPGAALFVGIAHEAERREPLVALVVRRLQAPHRLLLRVGQKDAHAPDEVLAELLRAAVARAGVAVGGRRLLEDL